MKILLLTIVAAAWLVSGCALWRKSDAVQEPPAGAVINLSSTNGIAPAPAASATNASKLIVTPESGMAGTVATYNEAGHFVVLDFPLGHMPTAEQRMYVYRNGLKVGEVRITGPQKENHTVADLAAGEAQRGDEVRDK